MASSLRVYRLALEMVRRVYALLPIIRRHDKHLADQAGRAVGHIPLHIVEAVARSGRDRTHLLTVAIGSTDEVHAALDVAWAAGFITAAQHRHVIEVKREVAPMLVTMRGKR